MFAHTVQLVINTPSVPIKVTALFYFADVKSVTLIGMEGVYYTSRQSFCAGWDMQLSKIVNVVNKCLPRWTQKSKFGMVVISDCTQYLHHVLRLTNIDRALAWDCIGLQKAKCEKIS